jgi:hypothetical protein
MRAPRSVSIPCSYLSLLPFLLESLAPTSPCSLCLCPLLLSPPASIFVCVPCFYLSLFSSSPAFLAPTSPCSHLRLRPFLLPLPAPVFTCIPFSHLSLLPSSPGDDWHWLRITLSTIRLHNNGPSSNYCSVAYSKIVPISSVQSACLFRISMTKYIFKTVQ